MADKKQKRDAAATSEQILDAAEILFADHGFAHVSVREIADSAGVTKSLIHHHFGSKADLWNAVKERAFGGYLDAQIEALTNAAATDGLLRGSIEMYFRYLEQHPRLVRIMGWATIEGDENPVGARLMPLGVMRIKEAQAAGRFRADISPEMALATFISATTYWFQAKHLFKTTLDASCGDVPADDASRNSAFIDNFLTIFFNGLLTDSARLVDDSEDKTHA